MIKINTVPLLGLEDRIGNELTWTTLSVLHNQVTDPLPTPQKIYIIFGKQTSDL